MAEAAVHCPIHQFDTKPVVAVSNMLMLLFSSSTVAPAAACPIVVESRSLTTMTEPAGSVFPPAAGSGGMPQIMLVKGSVLQ